MRIGLTGHKGFLGTNLVKKLQEHELVFYEKRIDYLGLESLNSKFYEFAGLELIIHLAGQNRGNDRNIIETNTKGSKYLIDYCLNTGKALMLAGTTYEKESAYKASKDASKALCKAYGYLGFESCTLNLPKLFGPYCKPNYNSFVTTLIYLAAKGKINDYLYLITDLNEKVELLHVEDACDTIVDLIKHPASGFTEYIFTKYDGLITVTFKEIIDILNGNTDHEHSKIFLDLLQWYKDNDIYDSKNK